MDILGIIEDVNEKIIKYSKTIPVSLGMSGLMGYCIYFYESSRLFRNKQYEKIAGELIDVIYKRTSSVSSIDIENGFIGIGMGLRHLLKNGFLKGKINTLLEPIDIHVFRALAFSKIENPGNKLKSELLYYCCIRYQDQKEGSEGEFIFRELIFSLLNSYIFFPEGELSEPYSFSLYFQPPYFLNALSKAASFEPFQSKVKKIADEISHKLMSKLPVLHSHRLYLTCGMSRLSALFDFPAWEKHIHLLRKETDINFILTDEMGNRDIFIQDGLSGLWHLLLDYNRTASDFYMIQYDPQSFFDTIVSSDTWNELINNEQFLKQNMGFYRFSGVSLLLLMHNKEK